MLYICEKLSLPVPVKDRIVQGSQYCTWVFKVPLPKLSHSKLIRTEEHSELLRDRFRQCLVQIFDALAAVGWRLLCEDSKWKYSATQSKEVLAGKALPDLVSSNALFLNDHFRKSKHVWHQGRFEPITTTATPQGRSSRNELRVRRPTGLVRYPEKGVSIIQKGSSVLIDPMRITKDIQDVKDNLQERLQRAVSLQSLIEPSKIQRESPASSPVLSPEANHNNQNEHVGRTSNFGLAPKKKKQKDKHKEKERHQKKQKDKGKEKEKEAKENVKDKQKEKEKEKAPSSCSSSDPESYEKQNKGKVNHKSENNKKMKREPTRKKAKSTKPNTSVNAGEDQGAKQASEQNVETSPSTSIHPTTEKRKDKQSNVTQITLDNHQLKTEAGAHFTERLAHEKNQTFGPHYFFIETVGNKYWELFIYANMPDEHVALLTEAFESLERVEDNDGTFLCWAYRIPGLGKRGKDMFEDQELRLQRNRLENYMLRLFDRFSTYGFKFVTKFDNTWVFYHKPSSRGLATPNANGTRSLHALVDPCYERFQSYRPRWHMELKGDIPKSVTTSLLRVKAFVRATKEIDADDSLLCWLLPIPPIEQGLRKEKTERRRRLRYLLAVFDKLMSGGYRYAVPWGRSHLFIAKVKEGHSPNIVYQNCLVADLYRNKGNLMLELQGRASRSVFDRIHDRFHDEIHKEMEVVDSDNHHLSWVIQFNRDRRYSVGEKLARLNENYLWTKRLQTLDILSRKGYDYISSFGRAHLLALRNAPAPVVHISVQPCPFSPIVIEVMGNIAQDTLEEVVEAMGAKPPSSVVDESRGDSHVGWRIFTTQESQVGKTKREETAWAQNHQLMVYDFLRNEYNYRFLHNSDTTQAVHFTVSADEF
ncbi:Subtilisin, variant 2 [Balamuthia mandrillaris]